MARDLLMSRSGTKDIRRVVAASGRIAAIKWARTFYDLSFPTARKYVDEIIANKPWTYPLTSSQRDFADNPKMKNALKYYVGITLKTDRRQVFSARGKPSPGTHGKHFSAAIGPFSNLRAAMYVRDYGFNNPQIRCPADAEKLCRVRSLPKSQRPAGHTVKRTARKVRRKAVSVKRRPRRAAPVRRKNPATQSDMFADRTSAPSTHVKEVNYAYPSSTNAALFGFPKGCYVVTTINGKKRHPIAGFRTEPEAITYAETALAGLAWSPLYIKFRKNPSRRSSARRARRAAPVRRKRNPLTEKLKVGAKVDLKGRNYTVKAEYPLGPNVKRMMPELTGQYAVEGDRGSMGFLQTFTNGSIRLVAMGGSGSKSFQSFEINTRRRNPAPQLRRGERQGDIFANVEEPFKLAGQKGTDHEARQREKEAKAKATRDFATRNQLDFETNPRRNGKTLHVRKLSPAQLRAGFGGKARQRARK